MFEADHTAGATLLLRGGHLRKSMSDYLARRIERHEKVGVIPRAEMKAVRGDRTKEEMRLRDVRDGDIRYLPATLIGPPEVYRPRGKPLRSFI